MTSKVALIELTLSSYTTYNAGVLSRFIQQLVRRAIVNNRGYKDDRSIGKRTEGLSIYRSLIYGAPSVWQPRAVHMRLLNSNMAICFPRGMCVTTYPLVIHAVITTGYSQQGSLGTSMAIQSKTTA